eukprot:12384869-Prorocentrum_lima.AAC.1
MLVVGGSSETWQLNPIFDVYASAARHAMVEYFDQEMRDGNSPNALVVDGCSLYGRLRHPIGDKYHFLLEPENIARIDNFVSES